MKVCIHKDVFTGVPSNIPTMKSYQDVRLVWDNGQIVYVYLNTNTDKKRKFMQLIHKYYGPYTNLEFIPTDTIDGAHIRVNFTNDGVSWSRLGNTSVQNPNSAEDYSMQIGEFETDTILHEWGHAMGWYHEHTHPDKPWQFNADHVLKELGDVGWSVDEIYSNVLNERKNDDETPYDIYSIMHYYLPRSWTTSPTPFPVNKLLSPQDIYTLKLTYPHPVRAHELDDICDGFCTPSSTQIDRTVWDSDIFISFSLSCTRDQMDTVKSVIRNVYMPYFPCKVHYVSPYSKSNIRITFGPVRENTSVCGKQDLVASMVPNVCIYSECHMAVIIHHIGHVFGLRDNFMEYNCGNIDARLYAFLAARPEIPESIMSNQKSFSNNNFYLSTDDMNNLRLLYTDSVPCGSYTEEKNQSKHNAIIITVSVFVSFIVLYFLFRVFA
jgi:hypothetical protein